MTNLKRRRFLQLSMAAASKLSIPSGVFRVAEFAGLNGEGLVPLFKAIEILSDMPYPYIASLEKLPLHPCDHEGMWMEGYQNAEEMAGIIDRFEALQRTYPSFKLTWLHALIDHPAESAKIGQLLDDGNQISTTHIGKIRRGIRRIPIFEESTPSRQLAMNIRYLEKGMSRFPSLKKCMTGEQLVAYLDDMLPKYFADLPTITAPVNDYFKEFDFGRTASPTFKNYLIHGPKGVRENLRCLGIMELPPSAIPEIAEMEKREAASSLSVKEAAPDYHLHAENLEHSLLKPIHVTIDRRGLGTA